MNKHQRDLYFTYKMLAFSDKIVVLECLITYDQKREVQKVYLHRGEEGSSECNHGKQSYLVGEGSDCRADIEYMALAFHHDNSYLKMMVLLNSQRKTNLIKMLFNSTGEAKCRTLRCGVLILFVLRLDKAPSSSVYLVYIACVCKYLWTDKITSSIQRGYNSALSNGWAVSLQLSVNSIYRLYIPYICNQGA